MRDGSRISVILRDRREERNITNVLVWYTVVYISR